MACYCGREHIFFQTSVIHYGSVSESPADADWIKAFATLPHKISEQGVKPGSCQLNEYDSFYEYEMTIPNVTYTTVVSI